MPQSSVQKQQDVLSIKNLTVTFHTYAGDVKALDGVDLSVRNGEVLGLVGESGCGKSVTSLTVAGLLPQNAEVVSGEIVLDGTDLLKIKKSSMRLMRLRDIALVFQDPMTYLNPVLAVGQQITEILTDEPKLFTRILVENKLGELREQAGGGVSGERDDIRRLQVLLNEGKLSTRELNSLAKSYALSILQLVRLPEPDRVFKMYPFELSGGMRQRVMIAMALVRRPKLILADEISTALDVTVQAQILKLLMDLKEKIDTSVILITHDLAVVAEVCDRVAVMYAGNIIEVAGVEDLFREPMHPYTQGLLASIPNPDHSLRELKSIKGSVPDLIYPPPGCRFHPRCPAAFERCPKEKPKLVEAKPGHFVSCFLYGGQTA
jgi:peptide/nickel transport system ATP-binding protein